MFDHVVELTLKGLTLGLFLSHAYDFPKLISLHWEILSYPTKKREKKKNLITTEGATVMSRYIRHFLKILPLRGKQQVDFWTSKCDVTALIKILLLRKKDIFCKSFKSMF